MCLHRNNWEEKEKERERKKREKEWKKPNMQRNPNEFELMENPFFNPNLLPGTVMSADLDVILRSPKASLAERNILLMKMARQALEK